MSAAAPPAPAEVPPAAEPAAAPSPEPPKARWRKRRFLLRLLLWSAALAALLVFAGVLFLRSAMARELVRALVETKASARLDRRLSVGAASFSVLPPALNLREVRLEGPEEGSRPVVEVERLRLEAAVTDVWRGTWSLAQVHAVRPRIFLEVDEMGRLNLPRWRRSGRRRPFRLDALVVERGSFTFQQLELPLDFETRGFRARLLEAEAGEVTGQVTTESVSLKLPRSTEPYPLALTFHGRMRAGSVLFEEIRVDGDEIAAEGHGEVSWPVAGQEEAEAQGIRTHFEVSARGEAAIFNRLGYLEGEIEGPLEVTGSLDGEGPEWLFEGAARAPRFRFYRYALEDLRGTVAAWPGEVSIALERAGFAGGSVEGSVIARYREAGSPVETRFAFTDLDAEEVLALIDIPRLGLEGRVAGELAYTARLPDRQRGDGWGRFTVEAAEAGEGPPPSADLPVSGGLPLTIESGVVRSDALLLASENQRLLASGSYDLAARRGSFDFEVTTEQAGELSAMVERSLALEEPAGWLPSAGRGLVAGTIELTSRGRPAYEIRLDLEEVRSPDVVAERLRGGLRVDAHRVGPLNLELTGGGGALLATGSVTLLGNEGSLSDLRFDAVDWPLDLVPIWETFGIPLTGPISGRLTLSGPETDLAGDLRASVAGAALAGWRLGDLEGDLGWNAERFRIESLRLSSPAGEATLRGAHDPSGGALDYVFETGGLDLGQAPLAELSGGRLSGFLRARGTFAGTLERPRAHLEIATEGEAVGGRFLGTAAPSELTLDWDGESLSARGELLGLASVDGGGPLDRERFDLDLAVGSDRLRGLVEVALGSSVPALAGHFAGTLHLFGRPEDLRELAWELTLPTLAGTWEGREIEALEPAAARGGARGVEITSLFLGEEESQSEAFVYGTVGSGEGLPLDLRLQASLSTRWAEPWWPDLAYPGRVDLLGRVRGTAAAPRIDGQATARFEPFVLPFAPQSVDGLRATVLVYPDKVVLDRLDAAVGGGVLLGAGEARLGQGLRVEGYHLDLDARGVRLLVPEGWAQKGSAKLRLASTDEGREIRGEVQLEEVRYLETLDTTLTEALQDLLAPERLEVGNVDVQLTSTRLDVGVRAPETVRIRNEQANLRGSLDLVLRGDLAVPLLLGKAELEPGGTFLYAGNEYAVQRGLVTFTNPYRLEPELDLVARARLRQYEVTMNVAGTPERLDVEVASNPPLPRLDVLELVASGRAPDRYARPSRPGSSDEGELTAEALLYGQAATAITERVNTLFGFDKFRVDPLAEGTDGASSVRLTVGKRLSKDLFVTYSRDPSTTEEDILEAEWQVSPHLTFVFTQNGDGSFAVDALWDRQF